VTSKYDQVRNLGKTRNSGFADRNRIERIKFYRKEPGQPARLCGFLDLLRCSSNQVLQIGTLKDSPSPQMFL
jgi:hypothetical protein